ncbi:IclR family transcriptional regulator [Kribbella sp. NPDC020789]
MDDHTVAGRVAAILEVVAASPVSTSLALLAAETGIPKPTVRRIANQLVIRNILRRDVLGYRLGLRLIELGNAAVIQLGTAELAAPFVHELHERTQQIAWVGVLTEDSIVVVDLAFASEHSAPMKAWPMVMPMATMAATAAGHLMLAARPGRTEEVLRNGGLNRLTPYSITSPRVLEGRIRRAAETGTAHEWEETRLGWWCCASLVSAPDADYVLGLTAQTSGMPMSRTISTLRRVAEDFGRELGTPAQPPDLAM